VTPVRKRTCERCTRKATIHYKSKLQEVLSAGLNEITYDYVDSKQHFYVQYHVAATDVKALCKKQTTLQATAYLGFPAPRNKLSLGQGSPTFLKLRATSCAPISAKGY